MMGVETKLRQRDSAGEEGLQAPRTRALAIYVLEAFAEAKNPASDQTNAGFFTS